MSDPVAELRAALAMPGHGSSDFDLNSENETLDSSKLRPASVLIAVDLTGTAPQVILTKRSSALKHHPGQIAFPGGKREKSDLDVTATALREADEEIGLPAGLPQVLGHLPEHKTVTGFVVTPVIAILSERFEMVADTGEVEEAFRVPLAHLTNPVNYAIESRRWRGVRRHFYTVPYGPYYIWGATARMLRVLAARMET